MYAVFEDGSRQYRVSEGDTVLVDFRDQEPGSRIEFTRVLLYQGADGLQIGQPTVAGMRMKGRYADCGKGFAQIGKRFGRHICGKCFLLHYDTEYKEDDADFEACMPIRKGSATDGIAVRELPGGRCVSLLHKGPYEQLGRSYARILTYVKDKGYHVIVPTREVYLKGPGMIFKGNPRNYLTEIQLLVENSQ